MTSPMIGNATHELAALPTSSTVTSAAASTVVAPSNVSLPPQSLARVSVAVTARLTGSAPSAPRATPLNSARPSASVVAVSVWNGTGSIAGRLASRLTVASASGTGSDPSATKVTVTTP